MLCLVPLDNTVAKQSPMHGSEYLMKSSSAAWSFLLLTRSLETAIYSRVLVEDTALRLSVQSYQSIPVLGQLSFTRVLWTIIICY